MSVIHQVYERFLNDVAAVCDNNMQEAPMAWRDPFYITDLNKVLAISLEIDKSQQKAAQLSLHGHTAPISPKRRLCDPTWSKSLEKSKGLIDSSSSSPIWNVESSTSSSQRAVSDSSTDSPDSTFSPLSLPSPLSSIDTTQCDCGQVFRGLLQDRMSNLKRHIRTRHQSIDYFGCPVIRCDSTFNRQDNLNKHLRKAHPELGLSGRRGLTKSRRSLARG